MDERLRELERRWLATGAPADRMAWLEARERSGDVGARRDLVREIVLAIDLRPRSIPYAIYPIPERMTSSPARRVRFRTQLTARAQADLADGSWVVKTNVPKPGKHLPALVRVVKLEPRPPEPYGGGGDGRAWWVPHTPEDARVLRGASFRNRRLSLWWEILGDPDVPATPASPILWIPGMEER